MKVLHIVDDVDLISANQHQHQFAESLYNSHQVITFGLNDIIGKKLQGQVDLIISCLSQRVLYRNLNLVKNYVNNNQIVIYDQKPWEAFNFGSQSLGSYDVIMEQLNVKTFAVPSQWWVKFISLRGMPSICTPIWILPKYCNPNPNWLIRTDRVGYIGSVHNNRFKLFEYLRQQNINVNVYNNSLNFKQILNLLSNIQIYVTNESMITTIEDTQIDIGSNFLIKIVEVAARGCFSIINRLNDYQSYLSNIETVRLYDSESEIPEIIKEIQEMNPKIRQEMIDNTIEYIRSTNKWLEAVKTLAK